METNVLKIALKDYPVYFWVLFHIFCIYIYIYSQQCSFRYNVHEKIVNFMAPQPMNVPPIAPKLFANLFGVKSHQPASAV